MNRTLCRLGIACVLTTPVVALAQSTDQNVVVLVNQNSADSIAIGNAYKSIHPGATLLNINVPTTETISIATYQNSLLPQVQSYLRQGSNLANTHYLVTTKGVPYRITGTAGTEFNIQTSNYSSVESELTLAGIDLFRQNNGLGTLSNSASAFYNPFRATTSIDLDPDLNEFDRASTYTSFQYFDKFKRSNAGNELGAMLLTTRLDGFTASDVIASLNRAQNVNVPIDGRFVLDRDVTFDPPIDNIVEKRRGDDLLIRGLQQELRLRGILPTVDTTAATITTTDGPVMAYVSLGTNGSHAKNNANEFSYITEDLAFDIADGSVFITYESFNATSFNLQGDGSPDNRSGQGQVAEWIARGGTAAAGHAFEPFDLGVSNEEILIPALIDGLSYAEAVWLSNELISWQNVPIGDPLMTWNIESYRRGNAIPEPGVALLALGGLLLRRRR